MNMGFASRCASRLTKKIWTTLVSGLVVASLNAAVDAPILTPQSADSAVTLSVEVECATAGAVIHYTLNGGAPTLSDPSVVSGSSISVGYNAVVRAAAWRNGEMSPVTEEEYRITGGVATGNQHGLALSTSGTVWAWGNQQYGRLGNGSTGGGQQLVPVEVLEANGTDPFGNAIGIAGGHLHSLVISSDGSVHGFGRNAFGNLGNDTTTDSGLPVKALKSTTAGDYLTGCVGVAAGEHFSIAVDQSGDVWSWGYQGNGRLGNGATSGSQKYAHPVLRGDVGSYPSLSGVRQVASGAYFGMAMEPNPMADAGSQGRVWVWGGNNHGWLGQGNSTALTRAMPVLLSGGGVLTDAWDVAAGEGHTAIARWHASDPNLQGTVWTCGLQTYGRLGQGTTAFGSVKNPEKVMKDATTPLEGILQVAAGAAHTLALDNQGKVWSWGYNGYGQLGDGTTTNSGYATQVMKSDPGDPNLTDGPLENIVAISAGGDGAQGASMAIDSSGVIWAWGRNNQGQLGNGQATTGATKLPVQVSGISLAPQAPSVGLSVTVVQSVQPGQVGLQASPSDPDGVGTIAKVEFYNEGAKVGEATASPWSLTISNLAEGDYDAYAVVTDNTALTAQSSVVPFTIEAPTSPGDLDGDGMPNSWETEYGLNPSDPSDAAGDLVGDGVSNLVKYKIGRNPTVSALADGSDVTGLRVYTDLD